MKPLRTNTHAKHRNGAKVAALVAAALLAASTAGSAELTQEARDTDNAVLVALGTQPKGSNSGSGGSVAVEAGKEWNEVHGSKLYLCDGGDGGSLRTWVLGRKNLNETFKICIQDRFGKELEPGTFTPLTATATFGNVKEIQGLLGRGANVNARDPEGYPPLLRVLNGPWPFWGYVTENAKTLLANGANVNASDPFARTALTLAPSTNQGTIRVLQAAGAKENPLASSATAVDDFGNTALMFAARSDNAKEMKRLIAAGADVNAANHAGNTALIIAAHSTNTKGMQRLIAAGADVNAANHAGNTALIVATMIAAQPGYDNYTSDVSLLLAKGANVNAANREGETALMLAAEGCSVRGDNDEHCQADLVKLLLAKGADVHARDNKGLTAMNHLEKAVAKDEYMNRSKIRDALKNAAQKSSGKKRK